MSRLIRCLVLGLVVLVAAGVLALGGSAAPRWAHRGAAWYTNCTALNARYPHGIGRVGARDHTSGVPVTNFKRSNRLYAAAMAHNRGLDRDKAGVACEQH